MFLIKSAPGLHKDEMLDVYPYVSVDSVKGITAYDTDNGELRGKYEGNAPAKLTVKYIRTFDNGIKKTFLCMEQITENNRDISLSKAPWSNIKGNYVTNVSIEVSVDDNI